MTMDRPGSRQRPTRRSHPAARLGALALVGLLAGCGQYQPPPPHVAFDGLPVSGSLADARYAGFAQCVEDTTTMRCRRRDVMLLGQGPYNAAVDLAASDGSGGFNQLTLWHDRDQYAVFAVGDALRRQGWTRCSTGEGNRGDQEVYMRPGAHVRFSMDVSYWGKRRLRIIPEWNRREPRCDAAPHPGTPKAPATGHP